MLSIPKPAQNNYNEKLYQFERLYLYSIYSFFLPSAKDMEIVLIEEAPKFDY